MNIELYIQSGIVESYVLGLVTPEEAAEFEQLLPHYPILKEHLAEFGYELELFAIDHEIPPPPDVWTRIEDRVRELPDLRRTWGDGTRREKETAEGYIPIDSSTSHIRVRKYWRTLFILVFILSKILLVLSIYYFLEYRHKNEQVQQLQEELHLVSPASRLGAGSSHP